MDYTAEERFVRSFIKKSRRDRLLLELTTPERRSKGLDRFCHQASELLDKSRIVLQGDDLDRQPEFQRFVKEHDEDCYILSRDFWMDEEFLPLPEAIEKAALSFDAVIIIGSTFAVIYAESMKGGRDKYLVCM